MILLLLFTLLATVLAIPTINNSEDHVRRCLGSTAQKYDISLKQEIFLAIKPKNAREFEFEGIDTRLVKCLGLVNPSDGVSTIITYNAIFARGKHKVSESALEKAVFEVIPDLHN
ncbi:hypothetical protein METBIDRAFT_11892 [Metschnikowia bicuspidata var. bicuspidata NRRL YB-4993]|uniref:Uncharacterized protein n=1 Tax=Metschnikowia bicuspidata var. bicuspidata NRRL YB-4993 TaxID=869754 RepID=A0A1A0HBU7_9ASCO|nr:hypothetical protein METBIDRAFT_11892 [Metschnikowia bicuspidata var. bicuspidata NRRL YB-4993]OBA21363.1 hypothetical protein METBIDRAFT_11892 [Metschnikowia bicuspidata var. bicuspidata NRRL YB-4993]